MRQISDRGNRADESRSDVPLPCLTKLLSPCMISGMGVVPTSTSDAVLGQSFFSGRNLQSHQCTLFKRQLV